MFEEESTQKTTFYETHCSDKIEEKKEFSINKLIEVKNFIKINNYKNFENIYSIATIGIIGIFLFYLLKKNK